MRLFGKTVQTYGNIFLNMAVLLLQSIFYLEFQTNKTQKTETFLVNQVLQVFIFFWLFALKCKHFLFVPVTKRALRKG